SPKTGQVAVTVGIANGASYIAVTDEGPGIAPTVRGRLFEPFASTKGEGRGLGLSICHEIAQRHGATLTLAQRRDRRGTIATITFPEYHASGIDSRRY